MYYLSMKKTFTPIGAILLLQKVKKKTIMGILSKHETEGQSVCGTKRELLNEFESLNAAESCEEFEKKTENDFLICEYCLEAIESHEGKQNAKKIDYTNDKIVTIL